MRCIMTGLNERGRSTVASIEEVSDLRILKDDHVCLWQTDLAEVPAWNSDDSPVFELALPPGRGMVWMNSVPPERTLTPDDVNWQTLHRQKSIDVIYVIDPVVPVLEDEEVSANAGDIIIERATMHIFRNPAKTPARLVGFS